jgi:hypothetical protein
VLTFLILTKKLLVDQTWRLIDVSPAQSERERDEGMYVAYASEKKCQNKLHFIEKAVINPCERRAIEACQSGFLDGSGSLSSSKMLGASLKGARGLRWTDLQGQGRLRTYAW